MDEVKRISDEVKRVIPNLKDKNYIEALEDYKAKWSFAEHGDYKTYVESFNYVEPGSKDDDRSEYDLYLLSPEWEAKRYKVLKRDNYTCQSCLSKRASDVHHLTYDHIYNEPLFDLIAVCRSCHESITNMDKGLSYQKIKHL